MTYLSSYTQLNRLCKKYLFCYMLESMAAGISFFIAIFLHTYLKLSVTDISLIVAANVMGNLGGSFLTSKILDRSNPIQLSAIALMIEGICFILITMTQEVWLLAMLMFLIGCCSYSFAIANNLFVTHLVGDKTKERTLVISLLNLSSNAGLAVGGIIVSLVAEKNPLLLFNLIGSLLMLVSFLYWSDFSKCSPQKFNEPSAEQSQTYKMVYLLSLFVIFMVGLLFAQQRVSYSIYLEKNFHSFEISFIFLLNSILLVFFLPTTVRLLGKFNQILVTGLGGLLLGLGMYFLQYIQSFSFLIIACILFSIGEILVTVFSQLLCFQSADKANKGKATGLYRFLYAFGTILGTLLGEKIQHLLGENYVWSFCGLIGCLTFAGCLFVSQQKNKKGLENTQSLPVTN